MSMKMFRSFLLILGLSSLAPAQFIGAGVKVGATPTKWLETTGARETVSDESGHFTVGPYVELRLPRGFAVEANALYRNFGALTLNNLGDLATSARSDAKSWEFPILGKYRFGSGGVRPFIVAGPTFRWLGEQTVRSTCTGSLCTPNLDSTIKQEGFTSAGVAAGGGLEFRLGFAKVSAEGRWTWYNDNTINNTLFAKKNQAQILVSFGF